jgi:hypothetical protein
MKESNGYAEQFQDWSEEYTASLDRHVAHAAAYAWQTIADLPPTAHPWFLDYAVHALWQTALPLCRRTRAWPQVLSVGEPCWPTPDPDLCPARHGGAGAGAVGPVTDGAYARRRAVRHWVRVTHAPRQHITRSDGVGQLVCGGVRDRYPGRQSPRGQHVGTGRERSPLAPAGTAGGAPCARR